MTHYHVAQIHSGSATHTSLHQTYTGAEQKLIEIANQWGIHVENWEDLNSCPDIDSWFISYLEVEW